MDAHQKSQEVMIPFDDDDEEKFIGRWKLV